MTEEFLLVKSIAPTASLRANKRHEEFSIIYGGIIDNRVNEGDRKLRSREIHRQLQGQAFRGIARLKISKTGSESLIILQYYIGV